MVKRRSCCSRDGWWALRNKVRMLFAKKWKKMSSSCQITLDYVFKAISRWRFSWTSNSSNMSTYGNGWIISLWSSLLSWTLAFSGGSKQNRRPTWELDLAWRMSKWSRWFAITGNAYTPRFMFYREIIIIL